MSEYLFTSESVSEGHPDKVSDQVSDAVLDAILAQDPRGRVACETLCTTGLVVVAGEITTSAQLDFQSIVRKTVNEIGYDRPEMGFDANTCGVMIAIGKQSPDIAQGVNSDASKEQGAGDQGLMFGYAVDETPELMPLSISLSHKLLKDLSAKRKSKAVDWLRPDAKSQVTVAYKNGQPAWIDAVVISTQHSEKATHAQIKEFCIEEVIKKNIPSDWLNSKTKYFINPTGRFVIGGPQGDCGLTGRKIIVDTYGGHGGHGGGAFSGKDPSKVDRSAAYAARHVAKNIVASGYAKKCMVQVAYAIGVAEPVSVMVNDFGTGKVSTDVLSAAAKKVWDLKPASIIKQFDLLKPKYKQTASYGHFGRSEEGFTWEKTDQVEQFKDVVKTLAKV